MPEHTQELRRIHWTECLPFTYIFRAFRLAAQPTKLVLALAMILCTGFWGGLLDRVWSSAGHAALSGETHGYPVVADFCGWKEAYERNGADALAGLMTRELKSNRSAEEIAKEVRTDRPAALAKAGKLLDERYKKLIDLDERAKREADKLKDLSDDERDAKLAEMVAASRAEYRDLRHRLGLLGRRGIFAEWLRYEAHYFNASFRAARELRFYREADFCAISRRGADPGTIQAAVAGAGPVKGLSIAANLCMMGRGVGWMVREHTWFAFFFFLGSLAIWAFFGGAICRIAAMHAARDERIPIGQALRFSYRKFLGFFSAPLIVDILLLLLGFALLVGGAVAAVPVLDILSGLLFFLALICGAIMALLIIGAVGGFSLMWPTIAVEGSDAFDAISRSYSYVLAKPWRTLLYAVVASLYGGFCILFVRVFIWLTLACTHGAVGIGTNWADRPEAGAGLDKLDVLWADPALGSLRPHVDWGSLSGTEPVAAFFIFVWVYILVGLVYAFAVSFYFSSSTLIYYLLRRDVDATDLEDVYLEEYDEDGTETDVSDAPVESGKPLDEASPDQPPAEEKDSAADSSDGA